MNEVYLNDEFSREWRGKDPFEEAFRLDGQEFRRVKTRRTFRFELNGKGYFAKLHNGVGWREIFKNLFQLKLPVLGAGDEYRACRLLQQIGVDSMTPCAYGCRGENPAQLLSFLVTGELVNTVSLEDFCRGWQVEPPPFRQKTALLSQTGYITGNMHRHGLNHRDCYICHFLLDMSTADSASPRLFVIDLHRAQIRRRVPYHYLVKDVAGLYFSAMDLGLTYHDILRFIRCYSAGSLRKALTRKKRFWQAVRRKAVKLYFKEYGRMPDMGIFEKREKETELA